MTTTIEAIYENGRLVLPRPLSLPEHAHVRVTIETADADREAWLKHSEDSLIGNLGQRRGRRLQSTAPETTSSSCRSLSRT